ncbi:hypothetical protein [uncultured Dokdonia sp.]|uniref:hypothetical protein n=1 Tax=uncultured Dokdonia sp. TaxID=575653 RepID=UPI002630EEDB|nr:hypothetical protein [uncultured Dokdonia sp.]
MGNVKFITTLIVLSVDGQNNTVKEVNDILLEFGYSILEGVNSHFGLNELINDKHLEDDYDVIREIKDLNDDFNRLQHHPSGGSIKYSIQDEVEILIDFLTTDFNSIAAVVFYVDSSYAIENKASFDKIYANINQRLSIKGVLQAEYLSELIDEEVEITNILQGNINKEYEYIIS